MSRSRQGGWETLGPFRYRQEPDCFPLGQDSLLLGRFATLHRGEKVCDLCCGGGALLLLLLARERTLDCTGVEIAPCAAEVARRNFSENKLQGVILDGDVARVREMLPPGKMDLVVSNPPYFRQGTGKSGGAARMEGSCTLEELCASAAWLLRNGGRFSMVYRPERLSQLLGALTGVGMEPKRLCLVQHGAGYPPFAVLVEAVRQGRPGLEILPALLLHPPSDATIE